MRELQNQLTLLLQLIYESENCCAHISDDGKIVTFEGRNNGDVARGDGVHAAAMPALAVALGNKYYANKNSFQCGGEMPDKFIVEIGVDQLSSHSAKKGHSNFSSLEEVRDALLKKELQNLLVSAQNFDYFVSNHTLHPISGYGATSSVNNCKTKGPLDGFEIEAEVRSNGSVAILVKIDKAETVKRQISHALVLDDEAIEIISREDGFAEVVIKNQITDLLQLMKLKKINYQGVIPIDSDGSVLMAHRKNHFHEYTLGYSTAGGHCSDPYHPQLGALVEFVEENGFKLLEGSGIDSLKLVGVVKDCAVFVAKTDDFELTESAKKYKIDNKKSHLPFVAEGQEFIPGTEEAFPVCEIRRKKLPLRNIPSLEIYLSYSAQKLEDALNAKGLDVTVEIPTHCQATSSGRAKIPDDDFGIIKIFSTDLEVVQEILNIYLYRNQDRGRAVKIHRDGYIYIDDLNPRQIIECLDGSRFHDLKEFAEKSDFDKRLEQAALIVQNRRKKTLSHRDTRIATARNLGEDKAIEIDKKSAGNLEKVKNRLRAMQSMPASYQDELQAEGKGHDDILTPPEKRLFDFLCHKEYWLHHLTPEESFKEIMDGKEPSLLDSHEVARRKAQKVKVNRPVYDWSGIGRNIFWSIGSRNSNPVEGTSPYTLISISFNDLLRNPELADGMWASDHFYSYHNGAVSSIASINGTLYDSTYKAEEDANGKKRYLKSSNFKGSQNIAIDIEMGDEVFVMKDVIEFMAYKFIEHLRCLGINSDARKMALESCDKVRTRDVEELMDCFFNPYSFILHNPTKFKLNNPKVKQRILTSQAREDLYKRVTQNVIDGDIPALQLLQAEEYIFNGFVYRDKLSDGSLPSLPIVTAINNGQNDVIIWLIDQGFYDSLFAINGHFSITGNTNPLNKYNIAKAIFDKKNKNLYEFLAARGVSGVFYIDIFSHGSKEMIAWYEENFFKSLSCYDALVVSNIAVGTNDLEALQYMIEKAEASGKVIECTVDNIISNIKRGRLEIAIFLSRKYRIIAPIEKILSLIESETDNKVKMNMARYAIEMDAANVNSVVILDSVKFSLLSYFILRNEFDFVKELIEKKGAIIDNSAEFEHSHPLLLAIEFGNSDLIDFFLKGGHFIKDGTKKYLLNYLLNNSIVESKKSYDEKIEIVKRLISHNFDLNYSNHLLVYAANYYADNQNSDLLDLVLEKSSAEITNDAFGAIAINARTDRSLIEKFLQKNASLVKSDQNFKDSKDFVAWIFSDSPHLAYSTRLSDPAGWKEFFEKISQEEFNKIFKISAPAPNKDEIVHLLELLPSNVGAIVKNMQETKQLYKDQYNVILPQIRNLFYTLLSTNNPKRAIECSQLAIHFSQQQAGKDRIFSDEEIIDLINKASDEHLQLLQKTAPFILACKFSCVATDNEKIIGLLDKIADRDPFFYGRDDIFNIVYLALYNNTPERLYDLLSSSEFNEKTLRFTYLIGDSGNHDHRSHIRPYFFPITIDLINDVCKRNLGEDRYYKMIIYLSRYIAFDRCSDDLCIDIVNHINDFIIKYLTKEVTADDIVYNPEITKTTKDAMKVISEHTKAKYSFFLPKLSKDILAGGMLNFDRLDVPQVIKDYLNKSSDIGYDRGLERINKMMVLSNLAVFAENPELLQNQLLFNMGIGGYAMSTQDIKIAIDDHEVDKKDLVPILSLEYSGMSYSQKHDIKSLAIKLGFSYQNLGVKRLFFGGKYETQKSSIIVSNITDAANIPQGLISIAHNVKIKLVSPQKAKEIAELKAAHAIPNAATSSANGASIAGAGFNNLAQH